MDIVPLSRGGTDDPSNLRTLCLECNRGRGNKPPQLVTEIRTSQVRL